MFSKKRFKIIYVFFFLMFGVQLFAQQEPPYLRYINHPWVDSVMKTLTVEEQIAQCIWIAAYSNRNAAHETEISSIIKKYGVGGIVFFQGTAAKQAEMTNNFQSVSKVPLIIAMDGEWGVSMRLSNVERFPYQMTLGAITNDSLIYLMGKAIGNQFKRAGMQVNFAPVADINNNPDNPVINYRSFGENKNNVASKTISYMKGMQDVGIMTTAKHFPGHGDTDVDSHEDLPRISHSRERFDSLELYPFKQLIDNGIGGIMTAHLNIPAFDTTPRLPSTLSPLIINELLVKQLGFKGIVVTDAMNMQGVTKYFKSGIADAMALQAGNDVVEFVVDVEAAINETKNFINSNRITIKEIELKCRKNLALKYWTGLNVKTQAVPQNIDADLSPASSLALIRNLYASALTVLANNQNILPLRNLDRLKIATLAISSTSTTSYQTQLGKYLNMDNYNINPADSRAVTEVLKKLSDYDIVLAGVYGLDQRPTRNFGITNELSSFIDKLTKDNKCVITWFGNPYGIDKIKSLQDAAGLILTYQENRYVEELSAQLIFGAIGAQGILPVTINEKWKSGFGIITQGNLRMQYGLPENAGLSSKLLAQKIDSIANAGLRAKAYPGCVVMVARKGIVTYQKAYGYHTYDNKIPVQEDDLYDLASVTKISAPLPGFMLLTSQGKFSPDKTLGSYLPFFRNSNKENLLLKEIFTHQAGLVPFIAFYRNTTEDDGSYKPDIVSPSLSEDFPVMMAPNAYLHKDYRQEMFEEIKASNLGRKRYVYSDLGFVITPQIIEDIVGEPWNEFVTNNIYKKIGAGDIIFNPRSQYPLSRLVPTENEPLFRKQLLHGTVHDETASMLGGISGHAGLFATSNDLMKLMELYRRMGSYGGEQLIAENVMKDYTGVQFAKNNNRRGLGFDKPLLDNAKQPEKDAYPCKDASPSSFGHTGFTGTFVWVDPEKEISVIFLSNRVYPTRANNKISDLKIRGSILQAVYDSISD